LRVRGERSSCCGEENEPKQGAHCVSGKKLIRDWRVAPNFSDKGVTIKVKRGVSKKP
jgi:hypothetical protein